MVRVIYMYSKSVAHAYKLSPSKIIQDYVKKCSAPFKKMWKFLTGSFVYLNYLLCSLISIVKRKDKEQV